MEHRGIIYYYLHLRFGVTPIVLEKWPYRPRKEEERRVVKECYTILSLVTDPTPYRGWFQSETYPLFIRVFADKKWTNHG